MFCRSVSATWPVILLLGLCLAPLSAQDDAPAPRVVVAERVFDFGQYRGQQSIQHVFTLRNDGDAELRILSVKTSCGCTTTGKWERSVPPGGTWELPVAFDPSSREGPQTKDIIVTTNDSAHEMVTLTIKGVLTPRFRIDPPTRRLIFGALKADENKAGGATRLARIAINTDETVRLGEVEVTPPLFEARLKQVDDPPATQNATQPAETAPQRATYELTLTLARPLEPGSQQATVRIATGLKDEPTLELIALASVPPAVSLTPEIIRVPAQLDRPLRRALTLRSNREQPLEIREVRIDCDGIPHEVETIQAGKLYRIWITVPSSAAVAERGCLIHVLTNQAGEELRARVQAERASP